MAKPPTLTDAQLVFLVEHMQKEARGAWPTLTRVKAHGRCTTNRARNALRTAQSRALQPEHDRQFAALAFLAGYPTVQDARQAVDALQLWRPRRTRDASGIRPLVFAFDNYTRPQLRALLALEGIDTDPGQTRRELKALLMQHVSKGLSEQSQRFATAAKVQELDFLDQDSDGRPTTNSERQLRKDDYELFERVGERMRRDED